MEVYKQRRQQADESHAKAAQQKQEVLNRVGFKGPYRKYVGIVRGFEGFLFGIIQGFLEILRNSRSSFFSFTAPCMPYQSRLNSKLETIR